MKSQKRTPVLHYLFNIAQDVTKLYRTDSDCFHSFLAQLLYLSEQERPYIQLEVSLLCTRVIELDVDDDKNLARMIKYIQITVGLPLIL